MEYEGPVMVISLAIALQVDVWELAMEIETESERGVEKDLREGCTESRDSEIKLPSAPLSINTFTGMESRRRRVKVRSLDRLRELGGTSGKTGEGVETDTSTPESLLAGEEGGLDIEK